jgi:hypothetical protein
MRFASLPQASRRRKMEGRLRFRLIEGRADVLISTLVLRAGRGEHGLGDGCPGGGRFTRKLGIPVLQAIASGCRAERGKARVAASTRSIQQSTSPFPSSMAASSPYRSPSRSAAPPGPEIFMWLTKSVSNVWQVSPLVLPHCGINPTRTANCFCAHELGREGIAGWRCSRS